MQNILNNVGKPVWFVLMALGFMWFWPIGLAVFCYVAWDYAKSNVSAPWSMSFWSSGNAAFDKHQEEVRAQLQKEREDFAEFIKQKLSEKDQAEFAEFTSKNKAA